MRVENTCKKTLDDLEKFLPYSKEHGKEGYDGQQTGKYNS